MSALERAHQAQLKQVREEHAERQEALRIESVRIREAAASELNARRSEWSASLGVERERSESAAGLVAQLRAQNQELGAQYEARYSGRIADLESDKRSMAEEHARTTTLQKRTNYVLVILAIVLTIAGIAVGVIAGWAWGHQQAAESIPLGMALMESIPL